jgi:uncharacterized protein YjiS (DUF1127 family)
MTTEPKTSRNASFFATLLRSIANGLREARIRRDRRLALADLLRMPEARLDDFGINRQDIVEAFNAPPSATPSLDTLPRVDAVTSETDRKRARARHSSSKVVRSDSALLSRQVSDLDLSSVAMGVRLQPRQLTI